MVFLPQYSNGQAYLARLTHLLGSENPVRGGPTAQAQSHANEPIDSQTLHDITEGEKKITGGDRVKGGPTSTAQSILAGVSLPLSDSSILPSNTTTG